MSGNRTVLRKRIREERGRALKLVETGIRPQDAIELMLSLAEWAYELGRNEVMQDMIGDYKWGTPRTVVSQPDLPERSED